MNPLDFIKDFFKRLFAKSPKFFVVLQYIGIAATIVGALPDFLKDFGVNIDVLSEPWKTILTVAGIVTFVISKLPVSDDSTKKDSVNTQ